MRKTSEELKRNHALHNEKACYYLNDSGDFRDWVVTTAFYSALQFLKYKVFPLKDEDETFDTFDDYCLYLKNRYRNVPLVPHEALKGLVNNKLRTIAAPYKELFDSCHNARYVDYKVNSNDVQQALDNLAEIKKFCNTDKPKKRPKRPRIPKQGK